MKNKLKSWLKFVYIIDLPFQVLFQQSPPMTQRIGYIVLLACIGILIWAITMGTEKMIRLILTNYLIGSICFALGQCINLRANQLATTPDATFLRFSYQGLANFLHAGQLTFELIVFALLVIIVFTSSTISISMPLNPSTEKLYNVIFIPLTLVSFVFALYFALMADGIPTLEVIKTSTANTFPIIQSFIDNIFWWMFAHGFLVIMLTSTIKLKVSFAKKTTVLPSGLDGV